MTELRGPVAALTKHLQTLQIYPIFENCSEKYNFTALQFMCIVDFHANIIKLFDRIKDAQQPKLLGQLLQFREFEKFRYFHYSLVKQYGNRILQCKYCPLIGPCGSILSHMAINHNVHTASKICVFCNSETLDTYLTNNSLYQCHQNYIARNEIQIDEKVCGIVAIFYDMIRKLSEGLNICSTRRRGYAGQGYKRKELLSNDYGGDILRECEVRYMIPKTQLNRTICSETLDREFYRIMEILYGGSFPRCFLGRQSPVEKAIEIVIDSDSDNDEEVHNITTENPNQYQFVLQDAHTLSNDEMIPEDLVKREPRSNDSLTPTLSYSYETPMASTSSPMELRSNRLSTFSSASRSFSNWTPTNESEEFALNIARKLEKIPPSKRRQLEIDIEMKILQTETEAIQDGCCQ